MKKTLKIVRIHHFPFIPLLATTINAYDMIKKQIPGTSF